MSSRHLAPGTDLDPTNSEIRGVRAEQDGETTHDAVEEASSTMSVVLSRSVSVVYTMTTLPAPKVLTMVGFDFEVWPKREKNEVHEATRMTLIHGSAHAVHAVLMRHGTLF